MPKLDIPEVVLNKNILNQPFKTQWLFWETDLIFLEEFTNNQIIIRTHDKVIQKSRIFYSNTETLAEPGQYQIQQTNLNIKFIVDQKGWVKHVTNNGSIHNDFNQTKLVPFKEFSLEWEGLNPNLKPVEVKKNIAGYRMGIDYDLLELRSREEVGS